MATAPARKPAPVPQGARPQPHVVPQPQAASPPPEPPDLDVGTVAEEDLYQVFQTEEIAPPPIKQLGRQEGQGLKLPFDKLTVVNQWFLVPPFPVDKEARRKEKQRLSSYVYKKRKDGRKFKLIEIDERFATDVKHPELRGRFGVWRVA